jgi:hypothetical protein
MLCLDTHVHLYDCYDLERAFEAAFKNLQELVAQESNAVIGICLVERSGQRFFEDLRLGERNIGTDFSVQEALRGSKYSKEEVVSTLLVKRGSDSLYVFPGRQIVTSEKIEVLGLFLSDEIPDGLSAVQTLESITSKGGVPVLCWAPGKWLFRRGAVVRSLIQESAPESLLVGDTSMRPRYFPDPLLHTFAEYLGIKRIFGSDPLPFSGEENLLGSYATIFDSQFYESSPAMSFRNALTSVEGKPAGCRSSLSNVMRRLWRNSQARREVSVNS